MRSDIKFDDEYKRRVKKGEKIFTVRNSNKSGSFCLDGEMYTCGLLDITIKSSFLHMVMFRAYDPIKFGFDSIELMFDFYMSYLGEYAYIHYLSPVFKKDNI